MNKKQLLRKYVQINNGAANPVDEVAFTVPTDEIWNVTQIGYMGNNSSTRVLYLFLERSTDLLPLDNRSVTQQNIPYQNQVNFALAPGDKLHVKSGTVATTDRFTLVLYGTLEKVE